MESVLIGLLASSPSAVVAIAVIILFLKYMGEERKSWRETVTTALDNNTKAITAQIGAMASLTESMRDQGAAISQLNVAVDKLERGEDERHDDRRDERRVAK